MLDIWMNTDNEATVREQHMADVGDYIELRAELNVLVGIAACPNDQDGINDRRPKPFGIKILAPE